jgi:hypothetical protein
VESTIATLDEDSTETSGSTRAALLDSSQFTNVSVDCAAACARRRHRA